MMSDNNQIVIATQEGKELNRLRNSPSFRIGVVITNLIKRPWRLPLIPLDIYNAFKKRSKINSILNGSNVLIVGLDTKGTYHSKLSSKIIDRDEFQSCYLITSKFEGEIRSNHSIIQGPREMSSKNPKGWNIMIERYISSYIFNNNIGKIILISDYPYKGVLDIVKNATGLKSCWIKTALPEELDRQTNHAEKLFDLILDSDNITLAGSEESTSNFPLQKRQGRKNILIDLPGKLERSSSKIVPEIRKILENNFEIDIFQIGYGADAQVDRMIPKKYLQNIDWKTVDLLISDGSIRTQQNISNSDCHVICIPDKKLIRDRQIERFSSKSLNEDIIVLNNPHKIAMIDAFENLLIHRPSRGQKRRHKNKIANFENQFSQLIEWVK